LNFELEGFDVDVANSAREAGEKLVGCGAYALIVLDVMLPDMNGYDLCRSIREAGNVTPVMMLTARGAADDRVRGLDAGADDYLPKPFELKELLARVRSLLRRRAWDHQPSDAQGASFHVYSFNGARIRFDTHEVWVHGEPVSLTQLELDLLRYFITHQGRVLSREELLENVWKLRNYPNTRTVDNFIVRLRKYFESDPANPRFFVSVRGSGYKFLPG
jgi:DNA-binding response OmpR family regulator